MRIVDGDNPAAVLARAFAHSLVPIALAYVGAHYLTLLPFQGQAMAYLASDPLGDGSDLFGTADVGHQLLHGRHADLAAGGARGGRPRGGA